MPKKIDLAIAVDIVIFTIQNGQLKVLLIRRGKEPFKGIWALPGGFVHIDEQLHAAAKRELVEETGVKDVYIEQLYTFGDPKRDPRGRIISVSYFALINSQGQKLKATTDAKLFSAYKVPKLGFDHKKIISYAIQRLKWKLEYTTVAFSLLPKKFTLTQLQSLYEIVLNEEFDKRNFRKKIFSLDIIQETSETTLGTSHRPAKLYKLKGKVGDIVKIL